MTTLVVGDIHGCARELERLVRAVRPTALVAVGDLYTKGPDPGGVWAVLRAHGARGVLGNHDARLLSHLAGERPRDRHAAEVVAALDAVDVGWRAHLAGLPLFLDVGPFLVVHAGVHPTEGVDGTTRSMAIAMRRFPQDDPEAPPWHATYAGTRPVIFGHDAQGGLVWRRRGSQPWVIGLDTGCVYGGQLSGYVVETDQLVQVQAGAVYRAVG